MAEPAAVKPPAEPARIEEGTVFLKNPSGAVHDMMEPHAGIDAAKRGDSGWRFASADEIREYCKLNNLQPPALKGLASEIKKAQAEGEAQQKAEIKAADAAAAAVDAPAIEVPDEEPRAATASEERLAKATAKASKK